jgi:ADP-ribose pyrophosphatase YjhB (NUDIX family)
MKFCHHCASPVLFKIPAGDDKPRHICQDCDTVFYQNPKNVVGTLPVFEDRVLLCKRAIEPRLGLWTLPAGFMENGESSLEGAIRETVEEAGARIRVAQDSLYTLFNLPRINQVYMFFRAELLDLKFDPGFESLAVDMFSEADIPWDEIAFPVVRETLQHYFQDRPANNFPVRMFDVIHGEDRRSTTTQLISQSQPR